MNAQRGFSLSKGFIESHKCARCFQHGAIRRFVAPAAVQSGHSRWSKIKHDKAKSDAEMTRQRGLMSKDIASASQMFGPDPKANPRLALLITKAKQAGFPKASIEAAIARGQGVSVSGAALESVTVEALLTPDVAAIIDIQTDRKQRTLNDVRLAIKEHGGRVSQIGYLFSRRGRVVFHPKEGVSLDDLLEPALEAGALDVEEDERGTFQVYTQPAATKAVIDAVRAALDLEVHESDIMYVPEDLVTCKSDEDWQNVTVAVDKLKEIPGVQVVYINAQRALLEG